MKKHYIYTLVILFSLFSFGCAAPQYFHDITSMERQKDLRESRSVNIFSDIIVGISTVCISAALDTEIEFYPHDQQFKKIKLQNPTSDTIYVNMLTDVYWDKNDYCDFMDIRIPPYMNCKVMVPVEANYHLYFSNTPQSDDDELLEIFTSDIRRISLKPGMTLLGEKPLE